MRIDEGLHKVDGVRGANAYLVERPDGGLTLIDTGMPGNADKIFAFIRGLGLEPSRITDIVLTHPDPDHMGSAAELKRRTGASLAVGAGDAPVLRGGLSPKMPRSGLGAVLLKLLAIIIRIEPAEPDVLLGEGDVVGGLRVMETPGHTPGHIALWLGDVAIVGDTLRGDRVGGLQGPSEPLTWDMEQALASGERIKAAGPRLILPGHGKPIWMR